MQYHNFRNRFAALLTSLLGGLALTSAVAAPLPLHPDGVYQFKENGQAVTYRISFTQAYAKPQGNVKGGFVSIGANSAAQAVQAISALENSMQKPHALVIKKDGNGASFVLSKKAVAKFKGAYSVNTISTAIGAKSVDPVKGLTNSFVFSFDGAAGALAGAEALSKLASVVEAGPLLGGNPDVRHYVPRDPYYPYRGGNAGYCWHLNNTGQNFSPVGMDINAPQAWDDYTGAGIRVSVVDDGLEVTHQDLRQNVLRTSGYDFVADELDPTGGEHGTAVGGLIAGANNTYGGLGVAFRARMLGLRFLGGPGEASATPDEIGEALSWSPIISISNNSWGPTTAYQNRVLEAAGFLDAATTSRGGRGCVMVCSAGNSAGARNSNDSFLTNSYYSMPISATADNTYPASYSTQGAGNMVAGPSGDILAQNITTTDRSGSLGYNPGPGDYSNPSYTNSFNGTSASAPIISGAVALMLQAKPSLGLRDINDIIARTAARAGGNFDWQDKISDGKIYHFSHDAGAGLMDVTEATKAAKNWKNLTADFKKDFEDDEVVDIPDADPNGVTKTFRVPNSPRIRAEKVTVEVTVNHPDGASLEVYLLSPAIERPRLFPGTILPPLPPIAGLTMLVPSETVSVLQERHPEYKDFFPPVQRPATWTYTTTQNWAQCAGGEWNVIVVDRVGGDVGKLGKVTMVIHGGTATRPTIPPSISHIPMPDAIEYCRAYPGYQIVATQCPLSYAAYGLPKGLKCDYLTGEISGTAYESGDFNVRLTARNEAGIGEWTTTLHVLPRIPAPKIIGGYFAVGTVGQPIRLQMQANDTPMVWNLTYVNNDPGGVGFAPATGLITGIPENDGVFQLNMRVANYCGNDSVKVVLVIQKAGRGIADGLDVPGQIFNASWADLGVLFDLTAVDTWFWGNDNSIFGGDSVVSPVFSYRTRAEMYTEVTGPVRVEFDWTCNNNPEDFVNFFTDTAPAPSRRRISGNVPWKHETIDLGPGSYTLRWEYNNATAAHSGSDQARVDHLQLFYDELAPAVSWTGGSVNSFGAEHWIVSAPSGAQCPPLLDAEKSSMEISVTGPGVVNFDWKVSSQAGQDKLFVYLDDASSGIPSISGEVDWITKTINIPAGKHRVRWTYAKDAANLIPPSEAGLDAGFVNNVLFTPAP